MTEETTFISIAVEYDLVTASFTVAVLFEGDRVLAFQLEKGESVEDIGQTFALIGATLAREGLTGGSLH